MMIIPRFGSMASVSVDLMEYIPILELRQKGWLVNELHQYCQDLPVTTPIKALRFQLAAYQVERQLGWQARVKETGNVLFLNPGFQGNCIIGWDNLSVYMCTSVFNCGLFMDCFMQFHISFKQFILKLDVNNQ